MEAALLPIIFQGICSAYRLSEQSVDNIHQRIEGADKTDGWRRKNIKFISRQKNVGS
jgi:hypothetical protein